MFLLTHFQNQHIRSILLAGEIKFEIVITSFTRYNQIKLEQRDNSQSHMSTQQLFVKSFPQRNNKVIINSCKP